MKPTPRPLHQKIFGVSLIIALALILGGSLLVFNGFPASFANLGNSLTDQLGSLIHSNLVVKIDHTKLAANGASQTAIRAEHPNMTEPVTAKITAGSGTITKNNQTDTVASFTYTAGNQVGSVTIVFQMGQVEESATLELLEPVAPAAPQILTPATDSSTNVLKPEIAGTAPADTKIVISNGGQVNTTTRSDKNGVFRAKLERALTNGPQTITAVAVSDLDIPSPPSAPIIINIVAEPLKYDAANVRYSPAKIIAGSSFAPFIPASLNTEQVWVELEGTSYELKDSNDSSIYTRSLPAPAQAGSYSATIILVDAADIPTRFEDALKFTVVTE